MAPLFLFYLFIEMDIAPFIFFFLKWISTFIFNKLLFKGDQFNIA